MNKNNVLGIIILSITTCFVLSACGPGQFLEPALTSTPTSTTTPTITLTPTITETSVPVSLGILGEWVMQNRDDMGSSTRWIIQLDGTTYSVETWGACTPADCYWNNPYYEGSYTVSNITENTMTITWNFPTKFVGTFNLELLADGRLQIASHKLYLNGRTVDKVESFLKVTP